MKSNYKTYIITGLVLILGIIIGAFLFSSEGQTENAHNHSREQVQNEVWTCSMHPQIRQEEKGNCPICGMELIPASQMEDTVDPDAIRMSKTARRLAQVETMMIGDQTFKSSFNFSGRLEINQDNTQSITANFKSRIEKLYINEEGEQVRKGQVLAELYSPEIQVLKEELELAQRQNNDALLNSITKKIENYELTISDVESMNNGTLKLRSPMTGVITDLKIKQGDNLKTGQSLMSVADLRTLWAIIDIYETDLNKVNVGDQLRIQSPNYKAMSGEVTFISPVLDQKTRSAKARVVIENPDMKLKPGVFITSELMESTSKADVDETLMIPKSAVLWTGKRSVVYQQLENKNGVYFKLRIVETGDSSSDAVEILSGLEPGDEIVTQGAFSIDSEAQLADKPSMMNPKTDNSEIQLSAEIVSEQKDELSKLIETYTDLKSALVSDDFKTSKTEYEKVNQLLSELGRTSFLESDQVKTIDELRDIFIRLSQEVIELAKASQPTTKTLYVQQCPMANKSEGASWLSFSKEIKNPYYGSSMLKCGSIIDSIQ